MKILLIGGCGYIGSGVYDYFKNKYPVDTVDLEWFGNFNNPQNINVDFDLLTKDFLSEYDTIVHTASNSSVPLCKDIYDSFENNVSKLLRLTQKLTKQKFIYASSSCVYGTSSEPVTESQTLSPIDGLTLSKTTIDHCMPLLDIEYYGLRFGSVNGWAPNMRTDLMINSMTLSALKTKKVNISNGYAHRPIISIQDICRAIECIIESKEDKRGIYNLASFNSTVIEIGSQVAKETDSFLMDHGNNYTYDFSISSDKFIKEFDFKFDSSVTSIVNSITQSQINENWGRRDSK